jgi:hypothetical protein
MTTQPKSQKHCLLYGPTRVYIPRTRVEFERYRDQEIKRLESSRYCEIGEDGDIVIESWRVGIPGRKGTWSSLVTRVAAVVVDTAAAELL